MDGAVGDFVVSPSKRQKVSDSSNFAAVPAVGAPMLAEASEEDLSSAALPPSVTQEPEASKMLRPNVTLPSPSASFAIPGLCGASAGAVTDLDVKPELEADRASRASSPSTVKSERVEDKAQDLKAQKIETEAQLAKLNVEETIVETDKSMKQELEPANVSGEVPQSSHLFVKDTEENIGVFDPVQGNVMLETKPHSVGPEEQEEEPVEFEFDEDDEIASQSSTGLGQDDDSISSLDDEGDSDSSSSSGDGDETDSEDEYSLLDPVEQARRLMAGESDSSGKLPAKALRTKNEKAEEVPPKPDITITPEMEIQSLGLVQTVVESIVLIQAKISGIDEALDVGTVLCLGDRTVVGVIADIFGKTEEPYYTMRFASDEDIKKEGILVGTEVFYVPQHAMYVQTRPLRYMKGTDASKDNDEPGINDDEFEFSDDEKEREHKLMKRAMKRQTHAIERDGQMNGGFRRGNRPRGGKGPRGRGSWRGRGSRPSHALPQLEGFKAQNDPVLSYDDGPSDEIYRRLTRPGTATSSISGSGQNGAHSPPPPQHNGGGYRGGRGGNGPRGRGRARGQGAPPNGYHGNQSHSQYSNGNHQAQQFPNPGYASPMQSPTGFQHPYQMPQQHYANNGSHGYTSPNNPYQQQQQQPPYQQFPQPQFPNFGQQNGFMNGFNTQQQQYPGNNGMPFIPPGSYINPDFFRRQSQGPPGP